MAATTLDGGGVVAGSSGCPAGCARSNGCDMRNNRAREMQPRVGRPCLSSTSTERGRARARAGAARSAAPPTAAWWRRSTRRTRDGHRRGRSPRRTTAFHDGPWPHTSSRERGDLLLRLADLLERDADAIARMESLDTGKRFVEGAVRRRRRGLGLPPLRPGGGRGGRPRRRHRQPRRRQPHRPRAGRRVRPRSRRGTTRCSRSRGRSRPAWPRATRSCSSPAS